MQKYFEYDYDGPPFELYGIGHLLFLVLFSAALWFLIWGWKNPSERGKTLGRWLVLGVFIVVELSWHAWNIANDAWTVQRHLPLHSCSITALGTIYVLITGSRRVYEIVFFIGIAGASQTLITPEAGAYGLPHFRALQTLFAHGLIILALVYMTTICGLRPTWASIWRRPQTQSGFSGLFSSATQRGCAQPSKSAAG